MSISWYNNLVQTRGHDCLRKWLLYHRWQNAPYFLRTGLIVNNKLTWEDLPTSVPSFHRAYCETNTQSALRYVPLYLVAGPVDNLLVHHNISMCGWAISTPQRHAPPHPDQSWQHIWVVASSSWQPNSDIDTNEHKHPSISVRSTIFKDFDTIILTSTGSTILAILWLLYHESQTAAFGRIAFQKTLAQCQTLPRSTLIENCDRVWGTTCRQHVAFSVFCESPHHQFPMVR